MRKISRPFLVSDLCVFEGLKSDETLKWLLTRDGVGGGAGVRLLSLFV